jgi:hypothetical protein
VEQKDGEQSWAQKNEVLQAEGLQYAVPQWGLCPH